MFQALIQNVQVQMKSDALQDQEVPRNYSPKGDFLCKQCFLHFDAYAFPKHRLILINHQHRKM
jgi:hypothetical protein